MSAARLRSAAGCACAAAALLLAMAGRTAAQQPVEPPEGMLAWEPAFFVLVDQLEYAPDAAGRPVVLEAVSWYGGARDRLWLRAEAEQLTSEGEGEAEIEALYGRLISAFFDALVGVRVDRRWGGDGDTRVLFAAGLEGLAPLWWELEPTLFVSQDGDISGRLTASYGLLFTQRLILVPRVELDAALQDVPEFGIASGINDVELGARLRYEIHRKFAPYAGVVWQRRVEQTVAGGGRDTEASSGFTVVAGLRLWY